MPVCQLAFPLINRKVLLPCNTRLKSFEITAGFAACGDSNRFESVGCVASKMLQQQLAPPHSQLKIRAGLLVVAIAWPFNDPTKKPWPFMHGEIDQTNSKISTSLSIWCVY